jgi:MFS family permease
VFFLLNSYSLKTIFLISFIPGVISVLCLVFLTSEKEEAPLQKTYLPWHKTITALPKNFNYFLMIMFLFGLGNFNKILFIYRTQELLSGESSSLSALGWTILLYAFFNVIRAVGEFSIGTLSDYVSRKNLLAIIGFGLFGIASLGFMVTTPNYIFWFIIFACAGLSTGTITALEKAYAASMLPENIRGTGLGVLQAVDGIGDLFSSIIVGLLWHTACPAVGFLYAAVLSFAAMFLLVVRPGSK